MDLSVRALFGLMQWCDSLFPAGGYAHSFGLEEAVRDKTVHNGDTLFLWIRSKLLYAVVPGEGVLLRQAHAAALREALDSVCQLDAEGLAIRLAREHREGGRAIGRRWIQMTADLYPTGWTARCLQALADGALRGDPAVAFALAGAASGRPALPTLAGYFYGVASGQVSAGLRLLPIGQGEGQRILHRIWEMLEAATALEEIVAEETVPSSFQPALEIRGMRHEAAEMRLFQS
ncbi:MAG: hypothetical protein HY282_09050 [Nitrospirae bacterium]|nr:hypothetical protein [Candidatus Manganitrophaceae bacterium]